MRTSLRDDGESQALCNITPATSWSSSHGAQRLECRIAPTPRATPAFHRSALQEHVHCTTAISKRMDPFSIPLPSNPSAHFRFLYPANSKQSPSREAARPAALPIDSREASDSKSARLCKMQRNVVHRLDHRPERSLIPVEAPAEESRAEGPRSDRSSLDLIECQQVIRSSTKFTASENPAAPALSRAQLLEQLFESCPNPRAIRCRCDGSLRPAIAPPCRACG